MVRHVDDLGRIVVPKEIRRILGINTGDPVEFFVHDGCVVVKWYDAVGDMEQVIEHFENLVELKGSLLNPVHRSALMAKVQEMKSIICVK